MTLLRVSRKVDLRELTTRTKRLGVKTRWAYIELLDHYWEQGELPIEDHDLAAAAGGISVIALRRMKVQLGWVFMTDATGRWRDLDLEAERAIAVALSTKRAKVGMVGAIIRHAKAAGLDLASETAEAVANAMALAKADGAEMTVEEALSAVANANPFASPLPRADGSIDRSSIGDSESIDRSCPREDEGEIVANEPAQATSLAISDVSHEAATGMSDARFVGAAIASGMDEAGRLSDGDLHTQLLSASGDNVAPELRRMCDVEAIRLLMREGFDLHREILPLLRDRVKAFDTPLRTFRGKWIRRELEKARAIGAMPTSTAKGAPPLVFVRAGTPEWDRCQSREEARGQPLKKAVPNNKTGQMGNWFSTPLPTIEQPSGSQKTEARQTAAAC